MTDDTIDSGHIYPVEPKTLGEMGLPETFVEALVCKYLFAVGEATGRQIERELCLPSQPVKEVVATFKKDQHLYYKREVMGDFLIALSDSGRDRARRYLDESMYVGPAPVLLEHYVKSVEAQSITAEKPGKKEVRAAFADILLSEHMLDRLGPAINSGRGLFLYGFPGNGKTTIAERITRSFGLDIWVPHAIYVDGEIIKFFDAENHERVPEDQWGVPAGESHDTRWVKIKRPTIVVGGELTMDTLELQYNHRTKITEPSVQLKSNCGTLVIDDFGRQRMAPIELLNRWIVPLEKRYDYLVLSNGKKIQVPFDQLIIFSTNLEPKDLVDDAFLRRIPYKLCVENPTEDEFRKLMRYMAAKFEIAYVEAAVENLLDKHYRRKNRPLRCCHPRDLLLQILNHTAYHGTEATMTPEHFDAACENYFAVM